MKPVAIGTAPGALTAAILATARGNPLPLRQILGALKPQGFNGHSIRTTVTTLVKTGALTCNRTHTPAIYEAPMEQAPASTAQRVLQSLRTHGPQFSGELVARFPDLQPFSVRNALLALQGDGRADRIGRRHQYRYFATGHQPKNALHLASVTGQLLRDSEPPPSTAANAPHWPATVVRLGPPMIGWRGMEPVEAAA